MEDNFPGKGVRWGGEGGNGSGGNVSNGEYWAVADEAWIARLPFTSCCAVPNRP